MNPWVEVLGGVAAVITTLCWIPQALHILRTKATAGVSLLTHLALLVGTVLWLTYGILIWSVPVIAANVVSFVLIAAIVTLKLRFQNGAR